MLGILKRLIAGASALRLEGAMLTDVGCVREDNEDSIAFVKAGGGKDRRNEVLVVVADGMGGHAAGEVASAMAVDLVRQIFFRSNGAIPKRLANALASANRAIFDHAADDPHLRGMGTTCTVIAFDGARIFLGHVGDSRAYLLRKGKLHQLSQDHTLVARMVREGLLTPAQARTHPQSNVITQSVGAKPEITPDVWRTGVRIALDDRLVVCSDGLHGVVSDDCICQIAAGPDPRAAARDLIAAARAGGGPDNISVGVFVAAPVNEPANASERGAERGRTRPFDRLVKTRSEPPPSLIARGSK